MSEKLTIPGKELNDAVKDLNSVLEKKDRIKVVGNSNANKIAQFTETILAIVEGGDEENIPSKAAEVYTKYIKEPMNEESSATPKKKAAPAKKGTAAKGKAAPAKKTGTAAKKTGTAAKGKGTAAKGKGKTTPEKKAPAKKEVERDEFGFSVNTKKHGFILMISEKPMKMSELKAETGDTYYNTVSAHPDKILKTSTSHFYVKGSPAEKLAKEIEDQAKKDKAAADKAKKTAPKKTTTTKGKGKAAPAKKGTAAKGKGTTTKKTTTKRRPAAKK